MEKDIEIEQPKKKGKGGYRPGAGRPKGSTEQVTIGGLLDTLKAQTKGRKYEDLLVEDFLKARTNNDTQLTVKYHNLILNKVMNTIAKIEVTDSQDQIEAKKIAFAEALAKLTGIQKE
jgi:hypothetical protein|tara:strand:+ start:75 stop:428 length:354 start_codon:yes stop_codon:yes gene_type:complete